MRTAAAVAVLWVACLAVLAHGASCDTAAGEPLLQGGHARSIMQANASVTPPGASPAPPAQPPPAPHMWPLTGAEIGMFVVAAVVLFIAAGAGVGGGPVLVPTYLLLGGLTNVAAVALSNVTILAGSVANTAFNVFKRHPYQQRPLIDYDLILLMQPPTSLGAVIGSFVNKLMPPWIAHILLAALLLLLTWRMTERAQQIFHRETLALEKEKREQAARDEADAATAKALAAAGDEAPAAGSKQAGSAGGAARAAAAGDDVCVMAQLVGEGGKAGAAPKVGFANDSARTTTSSSGGRSPQPSPGAAGPGAGLAQAGAAAPAAAVVAEAAGDDASAADELAPPRRSSTWTEGGGQPADGAGGPADAGAAAAGPQLGKEQGLQAAGQAAGLAAAGRSGRAASLGSVAVRQPTFVRLGVDLDGVHTPRTPEWEQQGGHSTHSAASAFAPDSQPPDPDESKLAYAPPAKPDGAASTQSDAGDDGAGGEGEGKGAAEGGAAAPEVATSRMSAKDQATLDRLLATEGRQVPLFHVSMMLLMLLATLLASMFSKRDAVCGSWQYWLILASQGPVLVGIWAFERNRILWKQRVKRRAGMDTTTDLKWNARNTVVFPAICSIAGLIAGMFGLGGAVVMTPLMLELGVQPQVTSATTQTMLLITTASTAVVYAQMGAILWDYAAVLMVIAFVATLLGQVIIDAIVKKLGRASLLVIVLACFFSVACVLTLYIVARDIIALVQDPALLGQHGSIC